MKDLEEQVRSLAEPVLERYGAELVELQVRRGRTNLIRVVADQPGGIDLDTCARVSEELGRMLDVEDPIPGRYTLEVTSPGLDRPLRRAEDFRKNLGRKVRIVLEREQHEGVVEEVGETSVTVRKDDKEGARIEVPFSDVRAAKIVLPW